VRSGAPRSRVRRVQDATAGVVARALVADWALVDPGVLDEEPDDPQPHAMSANATPIAPTTRTPRV